jgi:hypothetical protein
MAGSTAVAYGQVARPYPMPKASAKKTPSETLGPVQQGGKEDEMIAFETEIWPVGGAIKTKC